MVRFPQIQDKKIIETTVGFLRLKRIATMVRFPSNSSKKIIKTTVGFFK